MQKTSSICRKLESKRVFSFEFFPPKTPDGWRRLKEALRKVERISPDFVSVTYGAGGGSRDGTIAALEWVARQTTLFPLAHLTAVGHSVEEIRRVLGGFADHGVRSVLALRGDPPGDPGGSWVPHPRGIRYASDLVRLIKECGDFEVGVAAFPEGHPQSTSWKQSVRHFVTKCESGADFAITQMFFEPDYYLRLRDEVSALGCAVPIIPEIIPAIDYAQIEKFARLSQASFPADLANRLAAARHDKQECRKIGVEYSVRMATRLLAEGAPGLHYITLNDAEAVSEIHSNVR